MNVKIIECPRDAMQGWPSFIPTEVKSHYLNTLLKVGFDTLDFGSFVSPRTIPQMRDTAEVLSRLDLQGSSTRLLAIIANKRGAEDALTHGEITFLGFPFSVSQEFQKRNTHSTIEESLVRVEEIQALCLRHNRELVVYISMGFGNPYNEPWNAEIVHHWVNKLVSMGCKIIALSDTVGVSNPVNITQLFSHLIPEFPAVEFGAHLHSHPSTWKEKIEAAFSCGCRRFDSSMKGVGGCPLAEDELVGNLATENLVAYFNGPAALRLDPAAYSGALQLAGEIFR
ncbi:MAG: hydroxymethylglutaryl-CoA lyase [Bacteroidia bacterium]|nr:hydroxymethylglutaryl-CoA lyase [Bacteroidia bacterium]